MIRRTLLFQVLSIAALAGLAVLVSATLAWLTADRALRSAASSRFDLIATRIAQQIERGVELGVPAASQTRLPTQMESELEREPAIARFRVIDESGAVIACRQASGSAGASLQSPCAEVPGASAPSSVSPVARHDTASATTALSTTVAHIENSLGQRVGRVELLHDDAQANAAAERLAQGFIAVCWPLVPAAAGLILVAAWWQLRRLLRRRTGRARGPMPGLRAFVTLVAALSILASIGWIGWQGHRIMKAEMTPTQDALVRSVAHASASLVELALSAGIPAAGLAGVEQHFSDVRKRFPEIAGMALVAADGRPLRQEGVQSGADPQVIEIPGGVALHVWQDERVLARRLAGVLVDIALGCLAGLLIGLESMSLLFGVRDTVRIARLETRLSTGARPGQESIAQSAIASRVRAAVFLFMLAEEFTRPWLPLVARTTMGDAAVSGIVSSLPLVAFMAMVAVLQLPFALLSERLGRRRGFEIGALIAAAGYGLPALLDGFGPLIVGRLLSGTGFALVFVSAQGEVIDGSSQHNRARSLAVFVRAILVAGLCGPIVGGLFADRLGLTATWTACALLAAVSALAARRFTQVPRAAVASTTAQAKAGATPAAAAASLLASLRAVWRAPGLASMLLCCALPAKLALASTFYLLPIHLQREGYTTTEIGRFQTLYPLAMVFAVPLFAKWADALGRHREFVVVGALAAGACLCLLAFGAHPVIIACSALGFGLAQAMSISPQSALVASIAQRQIGRGSALALGLFRLVERAGGATGPAVASVLLGTLGFGASVTSIGVFVALAAIVHHLPRPARRSETSR